MKPRAECGAGYSCRFRRMGTCIFWRLGFKQSSLRHIARAAQYTVSDN